VVKRQSVISESEKIKRDVQIADQAQKREEKEKNQELQLAHKLSKIVNDIKKNSETKSFKKISELLESVSVTVSHETLTKNFKEHITDIKAPSFFTAAAVSKALNFSLDELRDDFFDFNPPQIVGEVQEKLLRLLKLHENIKSAFMSADFAELYKDEPVFMEFLRLIEFITNEEEIINVAKKFDEIYFIRYSSNREYGRFVEKEKFITELKETYIDQFFYEGSALGDFDGCIADCADCWRMDTTNCIKDNTRREAKEAFKRLLEETKDLNILYDKVQERNYIFKL